MLPLPGRVLVVAMCRGTAAQALSQCTENYPPVNKLGWPQGTDVKLYIDPAITGVRRNAVIRAFENWAAANGANGNNSNVTFTPVDSPPSTGIRRFTVNNQSPTQNVGDRAETNTFI